MGKIGRIGLKQVLPQLEQEFEPDLVVANAENLSHGQGISLKTFEEMREAGIDLFTSGNHIWKKKEVYQLFSDPEKKLIRPANYPPSCAGKGEYLLEVKNIPVLMMNLMGRVFFKEHLDCPFRKLEEILDEHRGNEKLIILIDFHAEATSEKNAFGWYGDGRVSAIFGTHTHIPTADETILPGGTAYISDIGMVGAKDSVIGIAKDKVIKNFLLQISQPHDIPESGICVINSVFLSIDTQTKKAVEIKRIDREVEVK